MLSIARNVESSRVSSKQIENMNLNSIILPLILTNIFTFHTPPL